MIQIRTIEEDSLITVIDQYGARAHSPVDPFITDSENHERAVAVFARRYLKKGIMLLATKRMDDGWMYEPI
jgi:hypothetical protein